MNGPPLTYKPDVDPSFQASGAWYCAIPGASPGGYSMQDNVSGESSGDTIVMKEFTREPAIRALRAIQTVKKPEPKDMVCLMLTAHEYFHCYVRLDDKGQALPEDLEMYSHPGTAWPAVKHAIRRWFPVNAFTRLLRFRRVPADAWGDFLIWFDLRIAERSIG